MSDTLLIDRPAPGVVVLMLNRPEVMNALDMALAERLAAILGELAGDAEARCIVITGAGERAFCSGNDINEMGEMDSAGMMDAFVARDPINWQVANHPKPIIMALNGIAYGAGALMAMAADIRIGSARTHFKVTASAYGGANATWTLPRLVGAAKAKEILMMGRTVDGAEAKEIGLLNQFVDEGGELAAAVAMASTIAANPPAGVQAMKQLIDSALHRAPHDGFQSEFAWMVESTRRGAKGGAELFAGFLAKGERKG